MAELEFLKSLVLIFGLSAIVVFLLDKVRVPSIVGFLIAGIVIGPHGLALVEDVHLVEVFAEIGVILLLFTIGLEFSLKKIMTIRKTVFLGGFLQVAITFSLVFVISYGIGYKTGSAIVFGFLIALSSTAIVLKLLHDRAEIDSPHGRISLGILIFQDLCVVLFMLMIPTLSGNQESWITVFLILIKSIAIVSLVIISARWLVPIVLHQVVRTRKSELFTITIIFLCLGTAFLTDSFGLSLALGAFIAGLIISESEYSFQAISDILPFRDSFNGLFFISIGMLMNLDFFINNIVLIFMAISCIIIVKFFSTLVAILAMRQNMRVSVHSAMNLAQAGEFSFVIAVSAVHYGILSSEHYQIFLSSSIATMLLTPFFVNVSPRFSMWLTSSRILKRMKGLHRDEILEGARSGKTGHVIIIGFGINGRNLALVLRELEVPYVILDLNNDTVLNARKNGETAYFGDGTRPEILHKIGIGRARVLVIAISDPSATRSIVSIARKNSPYLHIVVRSRYIAEVQDLISLGADEVIPEEFETSITLFERVLQYYQMPLTMIQQYADKIRNNHYNLFIKGDTDKKFFHNTVALMPDMDSATILITEYSPCLDKSIREIDLRFKTGVLIAAIRRGERTIQNPDSSFVINKDDLLYVIGNRESIEKSMRFCSEQKKKS